jgi:hypothetical protein
LTASITANDKPYDGNTSATFTCALTGAVAGDDISCTGGTATFASADAGTWTVTATGLGLAGIDKDNYSLTNTTATNTAAISSWWTLNGFYQPVGIPNTYSILSPSTIIWNTVKAGQTVPLKFNIYADEVEQTSTSAIKSVTLTTLGNCSTGGTEDDVDFTTTGATSLRYAGTPGVDGQFIQNWQTPKTANVCYRVAVTTQDGSKLVSFFKTKK